MTELSVNTGNCSFKNSLSNNPTKWSNTVKRFVDKLPTNCLSVFDHFVGLVLKEFASRLFKKWNLPRISSVNVTRSVAFSIMAHTLCFGASRESIKLWNIKKYIIEIKDIIYIIYIYIYIYIDIFFNLYCDAYTALQRFNVLVTIISSRVMHKNQRCIQNPVEHLWWSVLWK